MKVGFITCDKQHNLAESDKELIPLFEKKNISIIPLVWNDAHVDWNQYDHLVFRSVWDYHLHATAFKQWLETLAEKNIKTLNPVHVVQANMHKFYLNYFQEKGIDIIPTIFIGKTNHLDLSDILKKGWTQAVIKPAVSAGSFNTRLFDVENLHEIEAEFATFAAQSDILIQPFMEEIIDFGEISLIFFQKKYSHAVLKVPKNGEFRVQADFGGQSLPFSPSIEMIQTAEKIISIVEEPLLYARVDGIVRQGKFLLMELELIEPYLFLESDSEAKERFVEAVLTHLL